MTENHAIDVIGVGVVAFTTATGAAIAVEAPVVLQMLVGIGTAAISGYFAARIQTEKSLSRFEVQIESLEAGVTGLREEMRLYYERKSP